MAIGTNNNEVVDGDDMKSNLSKSKNIKKIVKSQRFKTNFFNYNASSILFKLNLGTRYTMVIVEAF